jgi:hypothetical protein
VAQKIRGGVLLLILLLLAAIAITNSKPITAKLELFPSVIPSGLGITDNVIIQLQTTIKNNADYPINNINITYELPTYFRYAANTPCNKEISLAANAAYVDSCEVVFSKHQAGNQTINVKISAPNLAEQVISSDLEAKP